ncbi:hypothetical protein APA22_04710 [Acetobacter pasteurianus IFO 3283-22]|uniref:Uncharacterized protein n=1 Tax=Acetobacter pasteurianus (strain NBRC 105184 / IFO 3283-01) TaxID=634452 RepID=C7JD19_ACEP3|nr:hypothetical protein APA01_04710 [Acetobacter pasteurianus IFO 3283-01]BAI01673.1 hypothetical protein APA03_04710 [Acetobacter pasteurianus IFO 3283-03]BAI04721.1 hypothetical protein APA07_04710 [Acetobacter pasteurianus IFO 3283-07]BAI07768.1 hypothetical protein APA22_04710 [Acetobacter pasteurianus IFO 3283-22]BAI10816.1 hypothetical protein APA26_04710 [Acetobacter pasteurianus IFO 3283-26]BAI13864.1 hypothetical protein APA32_04710 [Acetobacter pasteurianus IFO 3283-32]BAI16910.1 hy
MFMYLQQVNYVETYLPFFNGAQYRFRPNLRGIQAVPTIHRLEMGLIWFFFCYWIC